jgi:hypothetical protein
MQEPVHAEISVARGHDADFDRAVRNSMRRPTENFTRPVSCERRDLGLMHAENFGNLNLCQAATLQDCVDLQGWLRLDQLLLGVGKVEVCKRRLWFPRLREPWFFVSILPLSIVALGFRKPASYHATFPKTNGRSCHSALVGCRARPSQRISSFSRSARKVLRSDWYGTSRLLASSFRFSIMVSGSRKEIVLALGFRFGKTTRSAFDQST